MAASPELRRPSSPAEFKLAPFLGLPQAEDRGAETGECGAGVGCRTPTTNCSKIPPINSCPPAPRKTRRVGAPTTCKRRLSELELFRVGPELMGLLFRPLQDPRAAAASLPPPSPAAKRRRSCTRQDYEFVSISRRQRRAPHRRHRPQQQGTLLVRAGQLHLLRPRLQHPNRRLRPSRRRPHPLFRLLHLPLLRRFVFPRAAPRRQLPEAGQPQLPSCSPRGEDPALHSQVGDEHHGHRRRAQSGRPQGRGRRRHPQVRRRPRRTCRGVLHRRLHRKRLPRVQRRHHPPVHHLPPVQPPRGLRHARVPLVVGHQVRRHPLPPLRLPSGRLLRRQAHPLLPPGHRGPPHPRRARRGRRPDAREGDHPRLPPAARRRLPPPHHGPGAGGGGGAGRGEGLGGGEGGGSSCPGARRRRRSPQAGHHLQERVEGDREREGAGGALRGDRIPGGGGAAGPLLGAGQDIPRAQRQRRHDRRPRGGHDPPPVHAARLGVHPGGAAGHQLGGADLLRRPGGEAGTRVRRLQDPSQGELALHPVRHGRPRAHRPQERHLARVADDEEGLPRRPDREARPQQVPQAPHPRLPAHRRREDGGRQPELERELAAPAAAGAAAAAAAAVGPEEVTGRPPMASSSSGYTSMAPTAEKAEPGRSRGLVERTVRFAGGKLYTKLASTY